MILGSMIGELLIGFGFVIPCLIVLIIWACQFGKGVVDVGKGMHSAAQRELEKKRLRQQLEDLENF